MLKAAEFFVGGQQLVRLNEKVIGEVSRDHGINATELSILLFLAGNPDLNTAKDIVESRLMTKNHRFSRAVGFLVRQGYIHTREDDSDRRITHLVLEEKASPVIELGVQAQQEMLCFLCQGISEAELENFCRIHTRIRENAREAMKVYGTKMKSCEKTLRKQRFFV